MKKRTLKIPWKSFRFRVVTVTFAAIFVLLGILIFNNVYAIKIVRKQVFETNHRVLSLFMSNVDSAFEEVENFFVGLQSSSNMITAAYDKDDKDFYTAQARLSRELEAAVGSYGYMEDLFVYFRQRDQYMDAADFAMDGSERNDIRKLVIEMIEKDTYNDAHTGNWVCRWIGTEPYLMRILRMGDTYMGGCVKVSVLVERLREDGFGEMEYLSFCDKSGAEMGSYLPELKEPLNLEESQSYYSMVGNWNKYMMLSVMSSCGDYGLVALIRDNNILEGLKSFQLLVGVLCVVLVAFLAAYIAAMRKWVLLPLNKLVDGMKALSEGQFDVKLYEKGDCEEFSAVNRTFEEMIRQIQVLKIDIYEQKVQRQKAELQYMKLQINPHFYINCLNVIHNLSLVNKNNLVQRMTIYLGKYLRYTMDGNVLDSLDREIDCVENYLQIQQLRFPDSIICEMEIGENVREVLVPPLLLQTFVENTVKYQVVAGEITNIHIRVERSRENAGAVEIEIWDDGDGYPERVLDCLRRDKKIFDEKGEHYGIRNVCERLRLIYHENVRTEFRNHWETGGAYVRILLPDDVIKKE